MPFPVHSRVAQVQIKNGGPTNRQEWQSDRTSHPRSTHFFLFAVSVVLAFVLLLILAMRVHSLFPKIAGEVNDPLLFSELRVKTDGADFSVFGRRLAIGRGDYFLNIPYANATRFEPAQLMSLPRNFYAIHHGTGCPNGFTRTKPGPGPAPWNPAPLEAVSASEQCHTLNIYRCTTASAQSNGQLLPVLVYVHEGHWLKRSNANLEPSAAIRRVACAEGTVSAADGGMLVIAINYRMGVYGHFAAPHWPEAQRNLALGDVRTALEWVQHNIVHFGGHRAHVTVMGRGHGAQLVSLLALLPGAQSLFKRQVLVSGSAFLPTLLQSTDDSQRMHFDEKSFKFAIAANCTNEREWRALSEGTGRSEQRDRLDSCVRELSPEAIVSAEASIRTPFFVGWPILVGRSSVVPRNPFAQIPAIASMVGFCTHESAARAPKGPPSGRSSFERRMDEALREELSEKLHQMGDLQRLPNAGEVVQHYLEGIGSEGGPENGGREWPEHAFQRISADFSLSGPALLEAFARTRLGKARVYGFHFGSPEWLNLSRLDSAESGSGATNPFANAELACVDDLLFSASPAGAAEEDEKIAQIVRRFAERVSNFVTYGDPNSDERAEQWPPAFQRDVQLAMPVERRRALEDETKWLALNEDRPENALDLLVGAKHDGARFWLCELPARMGIVVDRGNCSLLFGHESQRMIEE